MTISATNTSNVQNYGSGRFESEALQRIRANRKNPESQISKVSQALQETQTAQAQENAKKQAESGNRVKSIGKGLIAAAPFVTALVACIPVVGPVLALFVGPVMGIAGAIMISAGQAKADNANGDHAAMVSNLAENAPELQENVSQLQTAVGEAKELSNTASSTLEGASETGQAVAAAV